MHSLCETRACNGGTPDEQQDTFYRNMELFSAHGVTHSVFKAGSGPGVLLMHELPGMTPEFWRLANWLAEDFTVWAPDLFGADETHTPAIMGKLIFKACISREIHLFAKNDPGPDNAVAAHAGKRAAHRNRRTRVSGPSACA